MFVSHSLIWKSRTVLMASAVSPRFANVTAATRTESHSSRIGSTIVGITSRSTYARGV